MKKLIYGTLFLAIVGIGFVACQKEKITTLNNQNTSSNNDLKTVLSQNTNFEFSLDEIESIGLAHNQILENVYTNNFNNENNFTQIQAQFLNLKNNDFAFIISELKNGKLPDFDIEYLNQNLQDQISLNYIKQGISIVDKEMSFDEIHYNLSALKMQIIDDSRSFNKTSALLFVEVAINSASFWLKSQTGTDVIGHTPHPQGMSKWVRGLIAADALGAAGTFLSYGLLVGITGPVSWGALLAAVGFSAAWSSATYALT